MTVTEQRLILLLSLGISLAALGLGFLILVRVFPELLRIREMFG